MNEKKRTALEGASVARCLAEARTRVRLDNSPGTLVSAMASSDVVNRRKKDLEQMADMLSGLVPTEKDGCLLNPKVAFDRNLNGWKKNGFGPRDLDWGSLLVIKAATADLSEIWGDDQAVKPNRLAQNAILYAVANEDELWEQVVDAALSRLRRLDATLNDPRWGAALKDCAEGLD